jgi:hypothetical protein
MADRELDMGADDGSDWYSRLEDAIGAARLPGQMTWLTSRGERVAAIVPAAVAEREERRAGDVQDIADGMADEAFYKGASEAALGISTGLAERIVRWRAAIREADEAAQRILAPVKSAWTAVAASTISPSDWRCGICQHLSPHTVLAGDSLTLRLGCRECPGGRCGYGQAVQREAGER